MFVKWKDSSVVIFGSNIDSVEPLSSTTRYCKGGDKVNVKRPYIAHSYNSHMGGVDLTNRFISDYRPSLTSKKWYYPLFSHILGLLRVAAWRFYTNVQPGGHQAIDQLDFTRQIVTGLLSSKRITHRVVSVIPASVSSSAIHKWQSSGSQGRCHVCKTNTRGHCEICSVRFHKKCFDEFHS